MSAEQKNKLQMEDKAKDILHQVSLRSFDWQTVNTVKVSFSTTASPESISAFKEAFAEGAKGTNAENANLQMCRVGGGMPRSEDISLDEVVCS